jgi:DmsE family decaheme c-type cytochrome
MRLLPRDQGGYPCARSLTTLAIVGMVCGALSCFSTSARAEDGQSWNDPIAGLRSYVQVVAAAQSDTIAAENTNQTSAGVARNDFDGDTYAALRAFSERIAADRPQSIKNQPKLADADSLFEWLQHGGSPEKPNAPAAAPPMVTTTKAPPVTEATYIGSKVCLGCHSAVAATYATTLMGRLQRLGKSLECETCHGPGSAHAKAGGGRGVGGIISYRANDLSRTAEENNAICLGCHERGERVYWQGSVHQVRNLACTNCHTIMRSVSAQFQLKTAFEPDTCFQCHKDRRAQMLLSSHMPIREGKVTCTNCHNPHGSTTEALIRQDSINDNCYTCHAEKRGPFLFEHAPVRENCLNCHNPHGSINEFSLKMSRPRLCFECHSIGHAETTGINSSLTMGRACQNCHQYIHGSNSPAGGALQR